MRPTVLQSQVAALTLQVFVQVQQS